jgi:hypothetical protein
MFPAEEPCVDGPGPRSNHRDRAAERGENDLNPRITASSERDPQFDRRDQGSHDRGPQADEEEYPEASGNSLRNHRWRKGLSHELDDPEPHEQDADENALHQKTDAGPTAGEGRKKSLQEMPPTRS